MSFLFLKFKTITITFKMKKILFLLLFSVLSKAQLSPKINQLYNELSKSTSWETKNISIDGHESEVYKIHEEIGKIAKNRELKYIALNGNSITKNYASRILFFRKSKSMVRIFKQYLKTNDSIKILAGCVRYTSFLPDEIYRNVYYEKNNIAEAQSYKKWKDSLIASKKMLDDTDLHLIEISKSETKWKKKEINSLIYKLDKVALGYKDTPQNIIELICGYHLLENVKVPYYGKIAYFEKKYSSEYIRKYMKFCRYGIRESIDY